MEESSGGGSGSSTFAADGDLTTLWEASTNTNVWVTLDLGDHREITALRLKVHRLLLTAVSPPHVLPKVQGSWMGKRLRSLSVSYQKQAP